MQNSGRRRTLGTHDSNTDNQTAPDYRELPTITSTIEDIQCPICHEQMSSLGQLNQHLDDSHSEVSDDVQELGIRSWFQKQLTKSTKLSTVATIGKSLRLMEDFERNGNSELTGIDATKETDSLVSTAHWQRESVEDRCSEDGCTRHLQTFRSAAINCRHCGKLYCAIHTLYQMRLSRSAIYEPHKGIWCRVCRACFQHRAWYNDVEGVSQDLTSRFSANRQRKIDAQQMKTHLLENRMSKLLEGISTIGVPSQPFKLSLFNAFTPLNPKIRELELSIVPWDDDTVMTTCRICNEPFPFNQGKHHCRLCGRCVCGQSLRGCSRVHPFSVTSTSPAQQSTVRAIHVRLCLDCNARLSRTSGRGPAEEHIPEYQKLYTLLRQYQESLGTLLTRYTRLVGQIPKSPTDVEAAKKDVQRLKLRLADTINRYDTLAKKIKGLHSESGAQSQVQKSIYLQASTFLQVHIFALQNTVGPAFPKEGKEVLVPEVRNQREQENLRNEIAMFTEQKYLLEAQAEEAKHRRKFEELTSLQTSVAEIDNVLRDLQEKVII